NDSGAGSLRQAILDSNGAPGPSPNVIDFAIGSGLQTIQPASQLPGVTVPVVIDGTSQPNYSGTPLIQIDGSLAGSALGLWILANNCTVEGLAINRFQGSEANLLLQNSSGAIVRANYLGIAPDGSTVSNNTERGISIIKSSSNT